MNIQKDPSNLMTKLIASLDLDGFEDMPTGQLTIINPKTKEPTSSHIVLASPEHEIRKRLDLKRTRQLRAEFSATGKMPSSDPLEDIEDETEYLIATTLSWNLTQAGQPLEFSADMARKLYTDPKRQWLRAQALEGLRKTELFIQTSAKA
jgi:hypothetical protein